jgi:carbonic anhydrase/acetyltransferase-like protein (isoleucine patch superfamily)
MSKIYTPKVHKTAYIHPSAVVLGRVTLKENSSVWPGTVLRGDINEIVIGKNSNIQDLSVMHLESDHGCYVGDNVVVGHRVILHACTVGNGVLVGMGAIIMNRAKIGHGAIIGAAALVTENMVIEPESLYLGSPARFIRKLTKDEVKANIAWAQKYVRVAKEHKEGRYKMAF